MNATQSTLTLLLFTIGLICLGSGSTQADTVFFDDFSDGSVTNDTPLASDGTPVRWTERSNGSGGDYDPTSGDYVLTTTTGNDRMSSTVVDIALTDTSIRTQVRTSSNGGSSFVIARVQEPLVYPGGGYYFGGISYNANNGGTNLILGRANGGPNDFTFYKDFEDFPVLPFDVRTEDAVLQLDVIGTELKLWGWKAGDPMPDQPQYSVTDSTFSEGAMRIANRNSNIGTFRYVHVADTHITGVPEPTTLLLAMLGMAGSCCYRRRR